MSKRPDSPSPTASPGTDLGADFFVQGPAGRLQCRWTLSDQHSAKPGDTSSTQTQTPVAVVAHPHPLYGGTMDNAVVTIAAHALVSQGIAALRFNFRATGLSEGEHDGGPGEVDDLRAVIAWLRDRHPSRALWAVGYSFGAATILRLPAEISSLTPSAVLLLAPPLSMHDFSQPPLLHGLPADDYRAQRPAVAIIHGSEDPLTSPAHRSQWSGWGVVGERSLAGVGHDLGAQSHSDRLRRAVIDCLRVLSRANSSDREG